MPDIVQRANIIVKHFPEYIGGTCLCGMPLANAADWAMHLSAVLELADDEGGARWCGDEEGTYLRPLGRFWSRQKRHDEGGAR